MTRMESPDRQATVSVKADGNLVKNFDEWVENSEYGSRSEALRSLMRTATDDAPRSEYPLHPPTEEPLAWAYGQLVDAANARGTIPSDMAKRVTAGGPPGYAASETQDMLLRPLHRRGYLRRLGNVYGDQAWELRGWDDE